MLLYILVIFAVVLSWQDIKYNSVSVYSLFGFCVCSAAWWGMHRHCDFKLFILLCLLGMMYKLIAHKSILGSADYLLSFFLSPFLYKVNFPVLLIYLGTYGVIISLIINLQNRKRDNYVDNNLNNKEKRNKLSNKIKLNNCKDNDLNIKFYIKKDITNNMTKIFNNNTENINTSTDNNFKTNDRINDEYESKNNGLNVNLNNEICNMKNAVSNKAYNKSDNIEYINCKIPFVPGLIIAVLMVNLIK